MRTFSAVLVGGMLIVGAAAGWRFWEINPVIASILGFCGVALIFSAYNIKVE